MARSCASWFVPLGASATRAEDFIAGSTSFPSKRTLYESIGFPVLRLRIRSATTPGCLTGASLLAPGTSKYTGAPSSNVMTETTVGAGGANCDCSGDPKSRGDVSMVRSMGDSESTGD
eukprot:ANDGO_00137.mRNA.1 hypothetical protein